MKPSAVLVVLMTTLLACRPSADPPLDTASLPVVDDTLDVSPDTTKSQPLLKDLGLDGRRIQVFVLPGDAEIESGGIPLRRRNGVVELTGKVGDSRMLRVFKGRKFIEEKVTITDKGAQPGRIEFKEKTARSDDYGPEPEAEDVPKVYFYVRRH